MTRQPTAPPFPVPAGACDCHIHVFGPAARYPFAAERSYTPHDALPQAAADMLAALGLTRTVIVQPSVYGSDNRCTLDGVAVLGERARAVAVVDTDVSDTALEDLHGHGARGLRLNRVNRAGALGFADWLQAMAPRVAGLGWHLQLYVPADALPALAPVVARLPVPVVFDHMGAIPAAAADSHPARDALLGLVADGNSWVKLSGAYRLADAVADPALARLAEALVGANPDNLVWASDWPHVDSHGADAGALRPFHDLDTGRLLGLLGDWVGDAEIRRKVLVDNPARLYDFPAA